MRFPRPQWKSWCLATTVFAFVAPVTNPSPLRSHALASPEAALAVGDGTWSEMTVGRTGQSMVHDTVHDRLLVFGGLAHDYAVGVMAQTLLPEPAWSMLEVAGPAPGPRADHSAIYDPVRDRMIVFGGDWFDIRLDDVWVLELAGAPHWTQWTPAGTAPSGRHGHSAIYDPVRDRMLVFGGDYSNDVWALSLTGVPTWTLVATAGTRPSGRLYQSVIYDSSRDRIVVFGGYDGATRNDVWALSLAGTPTWTLLTPTGAAPAKRDRHAACYDSARDRMFIFAGHGDTGDRNDVWTLWFGGAPSWNVVTPAGTPPTARHSANAIYDPELDRVFCYGGTPAPGSPLLDFWHFSGGISPAWVHVGAAGGAPSPRYMHTTVFDTARERLLVWGGGTWPTDEQVWSYDVTGAAGWSALVPAGTAPAARYGHTAIHDPVRDRMIVFGGYDLANFARLNDTWQLALSGTPAWSQLPFAGTPPNPVRFHSAIYDPVRDRMLVFGGDELGGVTSVLHELTLGGTPTWTRLYPVGTTPHVRQSHCAIYDPVGDRMLVFGGWTGGDGNDAWQLTLSPPMTWSRLTTTGERPGALTGAGMVFLPSRNELLLYGGSDPATSVVSNALWALRFDGGATWSRSSTFGVSPSARTLTSVTLDAAHERLWVFGGYDIASTVTSGDLWSLTFPPLLDADPPGGTGPRESLGAPTPNPTFAGTRLRFVLAAPGRVRADVLDAGGRRVRVLFDEPGTAGPRVADWNGLDDSGARVPAGMYFVRIEGPGLHGARRVVVLD